MSIAISAIFEKRLVVGLFLLSAVLQPLFGQSRTLEQAEAKAAEGDFPASISLYKSAIQSERDRGRRREIQEALDQVTRDYFAFLYQSALNAPSREEKVRLLGKTYDLELHGWVATEFEPIVIAAQQLTNEIFAELRHEAENAALGKSLDDAVALYDQARELDPRAFEVNRMEAGYQEVLAQIRLGERLVAEARSLLGEGRLQEARAKFDEAAEVYPGPAVDEGRARTDSMIRMVEGERLAKVNWHRQAEKAFEKALELDGGNEQAKRLLEQSRTYREHLRQARIHHARGECQDSRREFGLARSVDQARFKEAGLEPFLEGDCRRKLPFPRKELEEALLTLFRGEIGDAIGILESLSEGMGVTYIEIPALLGVAYGHSAYASTDPENPDLGNAQRQFRAVLNMNPDYQLPEKLFSPRISALLDQMRKEVAGE